MKNCIVYSTHSYKGNHNDNLNLYQLKYSVESIRKFNDEIDIIIYISPGKENLNPDFLPQDKNIKYIYFTSRSDPRLDNEMLSEFTAHKWLVSFETLRNFDFDNVLYLDTDIICFSNIDRIFKKYENYEQIVSKITNLGLEYQQVFGINEGMNDGTNLINRNMLKYADSILEERVKYVYKYQEELKKNKEDLEFNKKMSWIQWASCQFGVSEYMKNIGKPVVSFDDLDVCLYPEWTMLDEADKEKLCLLHYYNYNTHLFLPDNYSLPRWYEKKPNKIDWSN
jgi:hypothetical protein